MLEALVNIICPTILIVTGIYIMKILTDSEEKIITVKNVILIVVGVMISFISYQTTYSGFNTIISYIINIVIYKSIFKKSVIQTILFASIAMIIVFISDIICTPILLLLFTPQDAKKIWYLRILCNILISIVSIIIIYISNKKGITSKISGKIETICNYETIIAVILMIIMFVIVGYNLFVNKIVNTVIVNNLILVGIFCYLLYVFAKEKYQHNNLLNEYDSLFTHIQTFEDWIEREQLNRHEYKNQLAVLRCMTKEKKVKDKIDEILEDNINIEDQAVTQLKGLPKGGIKGLMYYKAAIAQKHKINLTTDVSIENKGILTKLSEKEVKVLCKLIGIYFDNAIEAAAESRKKNVTIEIYELKDKVSFVFSNTFKKHKNMKDRNEKGVSSKGEGRGNGLYFASKLIKENDWLEQKQDIVDRYYIQELIIRKSHSK